MESIWLAWFLVLLGEANSQGFRNSRQLFPEVDSLKTWAVLLDEKFKELTTGDTDITGAVQLQKAYQNAYDESVGFSIEHANGERIVADMKQKIEDIFEKNIAALKNLHTAAENAIRVHEYDANLSLDKVNYTNVNRMEGLANRSEYSDHFKQDIFTETSGVQIPIEIYEGYPEIINGIAWSQKLDAAFKANREAFPGIYWQSFGSQDGFLRVYPASAWKTVDGLPDLFDVRRRPWYIHGTSSPKDMVILLDTSGSMHGQSFDIMKIAAKTLLNTLGENDYVNVAAFSKNVTWVTPCLDTLVQANARNKRLLFDGIDQLTDRHIASYSRALEFAYTELETFEQVREGYEGSDCHKLIMVFSDGGTESPSKILEVYTNASRVITANARIFTYAVGPHPLPTVALKDMACKTGGAFTTITAMGAIRTKIQSYVGVITRPAVLSGAHPIGFSSIYLNAVGLGFVTTMTMPVFNTSKHSDNQTLAGVVGIDIPVSRFEGFSPRSQLGPLGYSFGINANGFLIFHPDLWMVANYLEDPAHNDMADIEGDSDAIYGLRRAMIDLAYNNTDSPVEKVAISTSVILQQGHFAPIDTEYFYSAIHGTTFSMAIVVPPNWNYILVPRQLDIREALEKLKAAEEFAMLSPWKYCDESKVDEDAEADGIDDLINKLDMDQCHGRDFNHLVWDIKTALGLFEASKHVDGDHPSRFAVTDGGLVMFAPKSSQGDYTRDIIDPYNSTLYKAVVLSQDPVLYIQRYISREVIPMYIHTPDDGEDEVADAEVSEDGEDCEESSGEESPSPAPRLVMKAKPPSIHLARTIRISDGSKETTLGVAGVEVRPESLRKLLLESTKSADGFVDCGDKSDLVCYLADTSGYVLASNQADVVAGDFLGVADPQIMGRLFADNFFDSRSDFNYQALCPTEIDCRTADAPSTARFFAATLVEFFARFAQRMWHMLVQTQIGGLSVLAALKLPVEVSSASEYGRQVSEGLHRCTTNTTHWNWKKDNPAEYHNRENITCNGVHCVREFHVYKLENVNAMLVVADPQWCSFCNSPAIFDGPREVLAREDCHLPKRYRKRPKECFAMHDEEKYECSSGNMIISTNIMGVVVIVLATTFKRFVFS